MDRQQHIDKLVISTFSYLCQIVRQCHNIDKENTAWQANNMSDHSFPSDKAVDQSSPGEADLPYTERQTDAFIDKRTEKVEKNER